MFRDSASRLTAAPGALPRTDVPRHELVVRERNAARGVAACRTATSTIADRKARASATADAGTQFKESIAELQTF